MISNYRGRCMIPDTSDPRWSKLIKGEIDHQFKSVPAGMCLSRNRREYQRNPSDTSLKAGVKQLHEFFTKFESILDDDIQAIFS